ncbi:hypothetical protein K523DRAFT_416530 [Schizophyllum commune Tattone D]|nr:hypothetical protein K523DRAFT_416530 [Schizophyllum commune Tattone D]
MDELVEHCMRQLSFDGDLGNKASRLRDFIIDFYNHATAPHQQNADDAFCAFVWSVLAQQPTVRVGLVPAGVTSEVWIAPQNSKRRKAKAKGEEIEEVLPAQLEVIEGAANRSLEELQAEYGDQLRIGIHQDAICTAITGSHIRSSKLSPMVYSTLQVVTRGRENGVTVVQIGQTTGYDQKTCHYLVGQLLSLDLCVKVRRGGVGTHFVIHKYFFERSSSWQAIREEELRAQEGEKAKATQPTDDDPAMNDWHNLDFSPIDARHLSSYPLVRNRVVSLLKASRNHMHPTTNLLIRIGFAHPTKTDRRFFQSRVREMEAEGLIDRVTAPSTGKSAGTVKCLRLLEGGKPDSNTEGVVVQTAEDDEDEQADAYVENGVKMNVTLHRQIIDLIARAGTSGLTLNDISDSLNQFDRRTVELLIARAEKDPPPAHIKDLSIVSLMETSGRERRNRYYTVSAYRTLLQSENLDQSSNPYTDADFARVGEFAEIDEDLFYDDEEELVEYQDGSKAPPAKDTPGKPGRKKKAAADGAEKTTKTSQKRKAQVTTANEGDEAEDHLPPAKKRKTKAAKAQDATPKEPKKRGRPSKAKAAEDAAPSTSATPKRKGRPPKAKAGAAVEVDEPAAEGGAPPAASSSLRRTVSPPEPDAMGTGAESPDSRPRKRARMASAGTQSATLAAEAVTGNGMDLDQANTASVAEKDVAPAPTLVWPPAPPPWEAPPPANAAIPIDPALLDSTTPASTTPAAPAPPVPASTSATPGPSSTSTPQAQAGKNRANLSHLRRENEVYQVLQELGGVMNVVTKDIYDAHTALLDRLHDAGEPTSSPRGTRMDKRTLQQVIATLENRGRIKTTYGSVRTHTGAQRDVRIAYVAGTPEEKLKQYLTELGRSMQMPSHPISRTPSHYITAAYGMVESVPAPRDPLPLQLLQMERPGDDPSERWRKNSARADQLFGYSPETIREVLLTERTTLAQSYGFIVPKMTRICTFHLALLAALERSTSSPYIASHEKRIIDTNYFTYDISVGLHLSVVAQTTYDEDLTEFLKQEGARDTLTRNLPPALHTTLQVGRARCRSRFLDLLEMMRQLGLVIPLIPAQSPTPFITCAPHGFHPTAYDAAPLEGWNVNTPMTAPIYWAFNDYAPIYLWALSEASPPFWKTVSVRAYPDAVQFWATLENVSLDQEFCSSLEIFQGAPAANNPSLARSLRRKVGWGRDYVLNWHQSRYLQKLVDPATAETPLDDPDPQALNNIARIVSAPVHVIHDFFVKAKDKMSAELEKARARKAKQSDAEREEDARAKLIQKIEEEQRRREQTWEEIVQRVHPEPLKASESARIKAVKERFLASLGTASPKWEGQLRDAMREAELADKSIIKVRKVPPPKPRPPPPPVVLASGHEKTVRDLIAQQGPPLPEQQKKRKREKGEKAEPKEDKQKKTRRKRFQWNRDYDELAMDASAIIRVRCRNLRLDWGAFEQAFPSVPRNTVRQRLQTLREAPGNEAYLKRLEDRWAELWTAQRGSDDLPDSDLESATNFDLVKHLEYLRRHIDKNALRVGFAANQDEGAVELPASVEQLESAFEVVEEPPSEPAFDFIWNSLVEDEREKRLLRTAVTVNPETAPPFDESPTHVQIAEAALKMTMGTAHEHYDAETAARLLRGLGEDTVAAATTSLLRRGILSKLIRDPKKTKPGRLLKISDPNQNIIGGPVHRDIFQDAAALEDISAGQDTWREWPLVATDGDVAALIQLVSEDKADFEVDTTHPREVWPKVDWNSKKADDDDFETAIRVRFRDMAIRDASVEKSMSPEVSKQAAMNFTALGPAREHQPTTHGFSERGETASCRLTSDASVVDCAVCIRAGWEALGSVLDPSSRGMGERIMALAKEAGAEGLTKRTLRAKIIAPDEVLFGVIRTMADMDTPALFWAEYTPPKLVHSMFLSEWTVATSVEPVKRVFPRRWIDIRGMKMMDLWEAALRAVMGVVLFRPGISQSELRWHLRNAYDRAEVSEVLRHLQEEGYLKARIASRPDEAITYDTPFDEDEEKGVFWSLGEKHWYQV